MFEILLNILKSTWELLIEMSPYLLFVGTLVEIFENNLEIKTYPN